MSEQDPYRPPAIAQRTSESPYVHVARSCVARVIIEIVIFMSAGATVETLQVTGTIEELVFVFTILVDCVLSVWASQRLSTVFRRPVAMVIAIPLNLSVWILCIAGISSHHYFTVGTVPALGWSRIAGAFAPITAATIVTVLIARRKATSIDAGLFIE